jgi:hypothetical protein
MPGTNKRLVGPVALTTTLTTNIWQGGNGVAQVFDLVKHIHVVNKTGNTAHFSLWLGATGANAAGTELFNVQAVPANGTFDYYCTMKLASTEYIVGGSDTATALTITIEGEEYVV